jgi:hypothetical protein
MGPLEIPTFASAAHADQAAAHNRAVNALAVEQAEMERLAQEVNAANPLVADLAELHDKAQRVGRQRVELQQRQVALLADRAEVIKALFADQRSALTAAQAEVEAAGAKVCGALLAVGFRAALAGHNAPLVQQQVAALAGQSDLVQGASRQVQALRDFAENLTFELQTVNTDRASLGSRIQEAVRAAMKPVAGLV